MAIMGLAVDTAIEKEVVEPDSKTILETLPDAVMVTDAQGIIRVWNHTMEMLTGYARREVAGKNDVFLRCVPATEPEGISSTASGRLGKALPAEPIECTLHRRDGGRVPVLKNTRRLHDDAGQAAGAVSIYTDLRPLKALQAQVSRLRSQGHHATQAEHLIGKSPVMQEVRERIQLAAESNAMVLILGETGTGKELVAEAIHCGSERRTRPLVKVNCSALPETLLESELFGHAKGAFTGALKDKPGRFEVAEGGTLFLDEIGDLSPLIQLKLLRALQDHEFERVGESRVRRVDVRILTATHRDLRRLVSEGHFREDLFYRLNVFPIHVPPLRERTTDILLLVEHFLEQFNQETGKAITQLSADVRHILMDFCWPGNVRQLENAIEHAFVTCHGPEIGLFDLPVEIRKTELRREICDEQSQGTASSEAPCGKRPLTKNPTKEELLRWLEECRNNKAAVARRAGVDRTTVWRWIKRFEVPVK